MKKQNVMFLFILLLSMNFIGCAGLYKLSYRSEVDPDVKINKNEAVKICTCKDDLLPKHYINQVVTELKKQGFSDVYSEKDAQTPPIKYIVYIDVEKDLDSYEYDKPGYGYFEMDNYVTICSDRGNIIRCFPRPFGVYGITGYAREKDFIKRHYFFMNWYDSKSDKKVFKAMGSTHEEGCSDEWFYKFLITQTIERLNFDKPVDFTFKVEVPEENKCKN